MKSKAIYDNIAGYVRLREPEIAVLEAPLFQRLRRIKQTGFLNYVFPTAEHTRFSHSLGVLQNVNRIVESLRRTGYEIGDDDKANLRLAGLLHDIGHGPLSHTLEPLWKERGLRDYKDSAGARMLLKNSKVLAGVLSEHDIKMITDLIEGKHVSNPLYNVLINAELDADRMDYLLRDAVNCGLSYGMFERDWLLENLSVHDGRLVVNRKARAAAEHYILGRFYMYSEIYSHHTVAAFDILAREAYRLLLDENLAPELSEFHKNPDDYWGFDDHWFFQTLATLKPDKVPERLIELRNRILFRQPLKVSVESFAFVKRMGQDPSLLVGLKNMHAHTELTAQIAQAAGVPSEDIFVYIPELTISGLPPYYSIEENVGEEEFRAAIEIFEPEKNESHKISSDSGSLLTRLLTHRASMARLYTWKEEQAVPLRTEVLRLFEEEN